MSNREPDNSQLRDTLLAKLMAESLASSSSAPGASCPDAETVAAYAERNLSFEETARLDVHFADCARCQTVLAALARSLGSLPATGTAESATDSPFPTLANISPRSIARPAKSPVSVGNTAQSTVPASKIRPVIKLVRPPQPTRWSELAPALGIAAAIALWFALRPAPPTQNLSAQLRTDAETSATQLSSAPAPALSDKDIANPNIAGANISAAPAPSPAMPVQPAPASPSQQEAQQLSANALASDASREDTLKKYAPAEEAANASAAAVGGTSAGLASRKELQASQSAPAPSAPPASEPSSGTAEASSATLRAPLAAATQKSAAPQPPSGFGGAAPAASIAPATERAKPAVAIDTLTNRATVTVTGDLPIVSAQQLATFASPNGAVTWRIGTRGSIKRSTDRGQTWEKQISGVFGDLTAGSATSNDIAWIVGRSGIILRTADGVHWQLVSLPPGIASPRNATLAGASPATTSSATDSATAVPSTAKSANAVSSGAVPPATASSQANRAPLDLVAVTATDALHATVVSGTGRRFTTSDGGQTWTAQ